MSRRLRGEDGVALIAVMSASSLLLALGLSLALTTTIEVGIAANQRWVVPLGWTQTIPWDYGLRRVKQWVSDNLDALKDLPTDFVMRP